MKLFHTKCLLYWLILIPLNSRAQDSIPGAGSPASTLIPPGRFSIGLNHYRGSFITTDPKAEYLRDSYASYIEVSLRVQTRGTRDWHERHNYPVWGLSFLYGNTGSREFIGRLSAVYAFLDLPLLRHGSYQLSFMAGAGPGFVSKPYDVRTNPKNTMIGTRLNAFINAALLNEFRLTERLTARAGLNIKHLSNGGTTLPNLGVNTPGITVGAAYSVDKKQRPAESGRQSESFSPHYLLRLQTGVSLRQASRVGGNHYLINVFHAEAGKRYRPSHYLGFGLHLAYNRSLDYHPVETPLSPPDKKKFQAGLYGSYEHFFGRLSFPFQVGFYLYNKDLYPAIFQQYGARFRFDRSWSGTLMLKSHLGQADYIHAGIAYKF